MNSEAKIEYARMRRNKLLERHAQYIKMCRAEFLDFSHKTPAMKEYLDTGVQPTDPRVVALVKERWEAVLRDKVQAFNQAFVIEWSGLTVLEMIPELIPLTAESIMEDNNNEHQ